MDGRQFLSVLLLLPCHGLLHSAGGLGPHPPGRAGGLGPHLPGRVQQTVTMVAPPAVRLRRPAELAWSESHGVHAAGVLPVRTLEQTWTFRCGGLCATLPGDPAAPTEHMISYVAVGDEAAPPMLLIHGFGASSFHWRSNINALADAGNRVYAIDLLGFGASDKPLLDYDSDIWVAQCAGFLREVGGCGATQRAVVAGNSIGGFTALALAAAHPELVRGIASLNGAGRFSPTAAERVQAQRRKKAREAAAPLATAWSSTVDAAGAALRKLLLGGAFVLTKQPGRIGQVLRQVYPVDPSRADANLVASIAFPARDPNAAEVFSRIVARSAGAPLSEEHCIDVLIRKLRVPLALVWGQYDPWIRPQVADRMEELCRKIDLPCERVSIAAGHCPMDEAPNEVNAALADFAKKVPP